MFKEEHFKFLEICRYHEPVGKKLQKFINGKCVLAPLKVDIFLQYKIMIMYFEMRKTLKI